MKTILVVDDLAVFREPLELLLKAQGMHVLSAADGEQALEVLERNLPDLVLLDLGMPVLDGIEVLRQIRQTPRLKDLPVLVLTAAADRARVSMSAQLGISGYVLKSRMSLQQVVQKVRQIVGPDAVDASAAPGAHAWVSDQGVLSPGGVPSGRDAAAARAAIPTPIGICRFGAPDLSQLQPLMSRGELINQLSRAENLQGFAPAVAHAAKVAASDGCSLDDLARAVRLDPMLSLRVLRMANLQAFARSERIDSVARAVMRLGLEHVRSAIAAAGTSERFVAERIEPYIHPGQFWEHSVACAIIAGELTQARSIREAEVAFTCGLLHDVGRLGFANSLGEAYVAVLHHAQHSGAMLEAVEGKMLLMNHADVADRMLQAWKLPRQIVEPVIYHHVGASAVRAVAPAHVDMVLRVALADRLAHSLLLGHSGNAAIYPIEEYCHLLGIDATELDRICKAVGAQMASIRKQVVGEGWPLWSQTVRTRLQCEFNPAYFGMEPHIDGYGVFCKTLAGDQAGVNPTVAIVHLAHENDGAMLRESIEQWKVAGENARLPVVVLQGPESGAIPEYLFSRQPLATISTPFAVSRFIEAVKLLCANPAARQAA